MPGFTGPKLLWVRRHEPEIFKQVAIVLLPKAYLRYLLERRDGRGHVRRVRHAWLDVAKRDWSEELLSAIGICRASRCRSWSKAAPSPPP